MHGASQAMIYPSNLVGKPTQLNCMFIVEPLDELNQGSRAQIQEAKV